MGTETLRELARQLYRRADLRVEWRRVFFDGRRVVVVVVLADEVDAEGCPRVCTSEAAPTVGEALDRLQARLSAQVARLPS